MRSSHFLVVGTVAPIVITAVVGCGQVTTPTQQGALAKAQPTPLPTVHIEGIVDRVQFTKPEEFCMPTLIAEIAEVVVGAHGDARWNTPDGRRPLSRPMGRSSVRATISTRP